MEQEIILDELKHNFGNYRAEWLRDKIFDVFTKPHYFSDLEKHRPYVLEGGRGSGKTTVLKGLSYQGQFELHNSDINRFNKESTYIGIYLKIDTNHFRAFEGCGIDENQWRRIFNHYFNLIICREIFIFLKWHASFSSEFNYLTSSELNLIAASLCLTYDENEDFLDTLTKALYNFQSKINNISVDTISKLSLSMSGAPIDLTTGFLLKKTTFLKKTFFLILDEYENFSDYQQQSINTLLKHASSNYTFKIGVRAFGWRVKYTLNKAESLYDPADYIQISIEDKFQEKDDYFESFAHDVCALRIANLSEKLNLKLSTNFEEIFQKSSIEEEALELGVKSTPEFESLKSLTPELLNIIENLPPLYKYLIGYWAKLKNKSLTEVVRDYQTNKKDWDTRYNNYSYDLLFKIRTGRGASGTKKYYSGWDTLFKLAAGNIRFLMELVYKTYEQHIMHNSKTITDPISPKTQTQAAISIGEKNIAQLESLSQSGVKLTRLILGLGKIFEKLAKATGVAPELNQFSLKTSTQESEHNQNCRYLIENGVKNLALIKMKGTKRDDLETREFIYAIHPIYAPFFNISFRKKRKIRLTADDICGLSGDNQSTLIEHIFNRYGKIGYNSNNLDLFDYGNED